MHFGSIQVLFFDPAVWLSHRNGIKRGTRVWCSVYSGYLLEQISSLKFELPINRMTNSKLTVMLQFNHFPDAATLNKYRQTEGFPGLVPLESPPRRSSAARTQSQATPAVLSRSKPGFLITFENAF
jgi:hypothetical protein